MKMINPLVHKTSLMQAMGARWPKFSLVGANTLTGLIIHAASL